jgi:carboxyl-terminal processing protease
LVIKRTVLSLVIALASTSAFGAAGPMTPIATGTPSIGHQHSPAVGGLSESSAGAGDRANERTSVLSMKDRAAIFEEVWKRISERYYDPRFNGVDWKSVRDRYRPRLELVNEDNEFYSLLNKMVGELHDAHTRFHTPRERIDRERLTALSPGISIWDVENKPVVISVEPGSEAERTGIVPGMTVISVNGTAVAKRLDQVKAAMGGSSTERAERLRLYRRLLDGEPGARITLGLTDPSGKPVTATISLQSVSDAPEVTYKQLASGYGYIKLTLWKSPIHDRFRAALEQLRNSPGIVIDLRDNPGGEVNEVLKIAGYFFSHHESFGDFITRSGKHLELATGNNRDAIYSGAVAILINESSGSGSEMFSAVLQENGRAVVVGRQSCGCLLGISEFKKLKGGGELAVSELGYMSPRGHRVEGTGVIPDEQVRITLSDLVSKRDSTLLEAETALRSHLKASTGVH